MFQNVHTHSITVALRDIAPQLRALKAEIKAHQRANGGGFTWQMAKALSEQKMRATRLCILRARTRGRLHGCQLDQTAQDEIAAAEALHFLRPAPSQHEVA